MQNTSVTSLIPYQGPYHGSDRNIWQQRSFNGELLWSCITWAFTAYWILFVAGAFLSHKEMNAVGGVIVLAVMIWLVVERLWVRLDAVVVAGIAAAICIPVLQIMVASPLASEALFKHVSLCIVMIMARLFELPVASESKMRWPLTIHVLLILLISLTIFRGTSWDGGTRHSGLFVNPNNLALIPFLLLFFVNSRKDKWFVVAAAHVIVIAVLGFSGTSGAVIAYAVGLSVHLCGMISKKLRSLVYGLAILVGLSAVAFVALDAEQYLPQTRLTNQISVIRVQLQNVMEGGDVAYYAQEKVLGPGSASGIWRVAHWRRTVTTYLEGTPAQQILGFGIGSSPRILGKLPHNEYLRILFEQGLLGFLLFTFAWYRIITTAPRQVRYVGLIVAIYSFSENNLDNFPFMALFILCLSARGMTAAAKTQLMRLAPTTRTPALSFAPSSI